MPSLFLFYLWLNYHQTWHDGTLGQIFSKVIKNFADVITMSMTLSNSFLYCSRSKFELRYLLSNLTDILHGGQFSGTDLEFEQKHPIRILFEREKGNFL